MFQAAFIYFFYVETKNRTLEELNEIFSAPFPKKASLYHAKVIIVENIAGHVKNVEVLEILEEKV